MINDILFCLLGKTGGVFIETEQGFEINQKSTFLTESEKELLRSIGEIGFKYSILHNFIENYYKIFNKKLINSHFLLASSDQNLNNSISNNNINLNNKLNNYFKKENSSQKKNKSQNLPNNNNNLNTHKNENAMDISDLENLNNNNHHLTLQNFQDQNLNKTLNENNNSNNIYNNFPLLDDLNYQSNLSDFLMPICLTIKNFLHEYEAEVTDLEAVYYSSLSLTTQFVISQLNPFSYKFDKIFDFLQIIINENWKGGELLNLIFNFSTNGDAEIKNIFAEIFINCNKILLNYITSWIINGSLATSEFFILSTNSIISKKTLNDNNITNINSNKKGENNFNNFLISHNKNNFNKFNNNDNNNNTNNFFLKEFENSKLELESWNANYYIEYSNIPSYFPQAVAEDILFIGKALKVLNSRHNSNSQNRISNKDLSVFYSSLQRLQEVLFNKGENGIKIMNVEILTKIINLIKSVTGKYLWRLIIQQNNFMVYLDAVKHIFLTFSGEFYFNFINKIKNLLNLPFDKRIENEINEIHFKNSLKEVFNIDTDANKNAIYGKFRIKLISHGFNFDFAEKNFVKDLINKKEIFLSNFSYYDFNSCLRFTNTVYQCPSGAIWNMSPIDIDEEFSFSMSFSLKNFTKVFSNIENNFNIGNNNNSNLNSGIKNNFGNNYNNNLISNFASNLDSKNKKENEILKNSLMKSIKKFPSDNQNADNEGNNSDLRLSRAKKSPVQNFTMNVILHNSKNFQTKNIPSNVDSLLNYFNFEFSIKYDNLTNKPSEIDFTLKFVNKSKKAISTLSNNNNINNNNNKNNLSSKINFNETGEFILQFKKFIISNSTNFPINNHNNNNNNIYLPSDFLANDSLSILNINFKDNFCIISNETNSLDFKFHFAINDYFPKDKRKILLGVLLKSQNIDIAVDLKSLNFNVLSGEIYNENSNLILIDYNPPWPHNFIFNDNILKMYNLIFNLLFPLKTNLILLNNIWIEKKNLAKKDNYLFTCIDAVHAEFVCFLQNLISFFMFDILELKFKNFISKCENCKDFELIIKYHEEFLGEVISNSFIRSKKIMNIVFDILYTTKSFCNFLELTLNEINLLFLRSEENNYNKDCSDNNDNYNTEMDIEEKLERIKHDLSRLKKDFNTKVAYLTDIFSKIKNSKYYALVSQLLIKLNYNTGNGLYIKKF